MSEAQILITENGPYLVSGSVALSEQALTLDADGNTWDFSDTDAEVTQQGKRDALSRCRQSANKPFWDGMHAHIGFQAHQRPA